MWPFGSSKKKDEDLNDDESVYTEVEYEEDYEYEIEVTDDEEDDEEEEEEEGEEQNDDEEESSDGVDDEEGGVGTAENEDVEVKEMEEKQSLVEDNGYLTEEDTPTDAVSQSALCPKNRMQLCGGTSVDLEVADELPVDGTAEQQDTPGQGKPTVEKEVSDVKTNGTEPRVNGDEEEDMVEMKEEEKKEDAGEDGPTSVEDKQSLLVLAAEHDRVDILKSILNSDDEQERNMLLHEMGVPPLHVAIAYGSTNATSCLLRMGANPAVRPNIDPSSKSPGSEGANNAALAKKYNGLTAWELAFGRSNEEDDGHRTFWGTPSKKSGKADIPEHKRDGIRHSFTAEALRCIGADEKDRLQQLLESGMPVDTDIGGKALGAWCKDMGATNCLEYLNPNEDGDENKDGDGDENQDSVPALTPSIVEPTELSETEPASPSLVRKLHQCDDVVQYQIRLEEQDSLAVALSACLDNLAEEVSVCHGLLLLGGGASALAAHVRSLKERKARALDQVDEWNARWEAAREKLAELGGNIEETELPSQSESTSSRSLVLSDDLVQLKSQLAVSEQKILKLRASIADMSEENDVALLEVEKRGLSGGIKLVRTLREELRELDYQLMDAKSGEAACQAAVQKIYKEKGIQYTSATEESGAGSNLETPFRSTYPMAVYSSVDETPDPKKDTSETAQVLGGSEVTPKMPVLPDLGADGPLDSAQQTTRELPLVSPSNGNGPTAPSEKISSGQSEALMRYQAQNSSFYFWKLFLRILGLRRDAIENSVKEFKETTSRAIIV